MRAALKEELWLKDLGRFAYYKDPTGKLILNGPYQTFIYPVIWGVLDELDSYTSMRHLRDRLMGPDGNVYMSNNFAQHLLDIWCTWGMQTGEAQQPWGAWGLAKVGLRNETYLPLKAAAEWTMEYPQLGTWPEVAYENRVGYFSVPPALYIQAVVEALFGLGVDKPNENIVIAPSFPDHWPDAKLTLPKYSADYTRKDDVLKYTVKTTDTLARKLRWQLEPCEIKYVKANGLEVDFNTSPSVNCIVLETDVAAEQETTFEIKIKPVKYELSYPASVAGGEAFELSAKGVSIAGIDDRCGILSKSSVNNDRLTSTINNSLLNGYLEYGLLGQMNFSKRTFFVLCEPDNASVFYAPVDIMILPRYEAAASKELSVEHGKARANILMRNNTAKTLEGTAYLKAFGTEQQFAVKLNPGSQKDFSIQLDKANLKLVSSGDNTAQLLLPTGETLDIILKAISVFESAGIVKPEIVHVQLPKDKLVADKDWKQLRANYCGLFKPELLLPKYADDGPYTITVPQLPGVSFKIDSAQFVAVSGLMGKNRVSLDLDSAKYKKLYLLTIALVDNHDIFSEIGQIQIEIDAPDKHFQVGQAILSRTLRVPGDVDYYWAKHHMVRVGTFHGQRETLSDLLPLLGSDEGDWAIAKPPLFPQTKYWASSIAIDAKDSTLNIIEIDLGKARKIKSVNIQTLGVDPALAIVAVTAEK